jgi:hypothetical protein
MQTGLTANDIRPVRALNVSGDFFNVLGVVSDPSCRAFYELLKL